MGERDDGLHSKYREATHMGGVQPKREGLVLLKIPRGVIDGVGEVN